MSDLRSRLRDGLAARGVPEEYLERLILVVDEVVSNSIEHGEDYRQSVEPIRVGIRRSDQGFEVEVDDLDAPKELVSRLSKEFVSLAEDLPPSVDQERGRGMFLVTMFLEDLRVTPVEGGGMRLQGRLAEGDI